MACWRRVLLTTALLTAAAAAAVAGTPAPSTTTEAATLAVLPPAKAMEGWRMREAARTFSRATLYEYIDGNADLFISYGFADLAVGDYVPEKGDGWISVDVYNMGRPIRAFGIFTAEKPMEAKLTCLGTQGYEADGLTAFWKGSYYVKVSLVEGNDQETASRLAQLAAQRIPGEAAMPAELRRLPAEGRLPGSERYLMKGALGHGFLIETVSAEYRVESSGEESAEATEAEKVTATLYVADMGIPGRAIAALQRLRDFEVRARATPQPVEGMGEDAFAVRDPYYGEMVAALIQEQYIVVAASQKASRDELAGLVVEAMASIGRVSATPYLPAGRPN